MKIFKYFLTILAAFQLTNAFSNLYPDLGYIVNNTEFQFTVTNALNGQIQELPAHASIKTQVKNVDDEMIYINCYITVQGQPITRDYSFAYFIQYASDAGGNWYGSVAKNYPSNFPGFASQIYCDKNRTKVCNLDTASTGYIGNQQQYFIATITDF